MDTRAAEASAGYGDAGGEEKAAAGEGGVRRTKWGEPARTVGVGGEEDTARVRRAGVAGAEEGEPETAGRAGADRGEAAVSRGGNGCKSVVAWRLCCRCGVGAGCLSPNKVSISSGISFSIDAARLLLSSSPNRVPISRGISRSIDSAFTASLSPDAALFEADSDAVEATDAETSRRCVTNGGSGGSALLTGAAAACVDTLLRSRSRSLSLPPLSLLVSSPLASSSSVVSAPSNSAIRLRCTRLLPAPLLSSLRTALPGTNG